MRWKEQLLGAVDINAVAGNRFKKLLYVFFKLGDVDFSDVILLLLKKH